MPYESERRQRIFSQVGLEGLWTFYDDRFSRAILIVIKDQVTTDEHYLMSSARFGHSTAKIL